MRWFLHEHILQSGLRCPLRKEIYDDGILYVSLGWDVVEEVDDYCGARLGSILSHGCAADNRMDLHQQDM
ncbi:hypothetical protein BDZ89DRAFT_1060576 [Hymenopellis radicata]|nr:hypothetical protein BDZ89DRAFT_1060576 [Hymenopellis radicata]